MTQELKIIRLKGKATIPYIPGLAQLRIKILRNYPYLYDGDFEYEENYLNTYVECPESVMVLVFDQDKIVGASTAIPLEFETPEWQQPFIEHNMNVREVFYLGESVLLPEYRGRNIYRHFFREREAAAIEYGSKMTAFCSVKRASDDPRRPHDYTSLDKVWEHFGYVEHPEMCAYFEWKEIGENTLSPKPFIFWLKHV